MVRFAMRFVLMVATLWMGFGREAEAARPGPTHRIRRYVLRDVHIEGNASDSEKKLLEERIWSTIELIVSENADELAHAEDVAKVLSARPELKGCLDLRCGLQLG